MAKSNFWGKLIIQLRTEQDISQRELATSAKVNRSTLRRIEDGTTGGDIEVVERILAFLGYDLDAVTTTSRSEQLKARALAARDPNLASKAARSKLLSLSPSLK